jgi:hypothetical protein
MSLSDTNEAAKYAKNRTLTNENSIDEAHEDKYMESYERAAADMEILCAAYPEEINIVHPDYMIETGSSSDTTTDANDYQIPSCFPLIFTLNLPASLDNDSSLFQKSRQFGGNITMEFPKGYPAKELQIVSYRSFQGIKKEIIEQVVNNIRSTAKEAVELYGGEECGLACCSVALECWNECLEDLISENAAILDETPKEKIDTYDDIEWITAKTTLVDRKSVFQAHVCVVDSDEKVRRAVNKLIEGNSKIQRATHNMYAYRFIERLEDGREILKHDNDDDGEDAAGSRLAQLLQMRKEDGVLVLVSRWYGGTHLGPKRFAHITNVARDLLVECHENQLL